MDYESDYNIRSVGAVIVSYNGSYSILRTIEALVNQVGHIFIIDNGSDELTVNLLHKAANEKISVSFNSKNQGIAHALNQGVRYAVKHNFKWILTMDQDSIAEENMVRILVECACKYRKSGKYVSFSPAIIYNYYDSLSSGNKAEDRYTVITSGNLIDTKVFEDIGYFEEKLFIDSVDFDFCLRLLSNNYKITRCHAARLFHALGSPVKYKVLGKEFVVWNHSASRKYYMTRNNIYILKKYIFKFPLFCLRKQIGMFTLFLLTIVFERNGHIKLKYMLKGLMDGICGNYGELLEK